VGKIAVANFVAAELAGVHFNWAKLTRGNFIGAKLTGASFKFTMLAEAAFKMEELEKTDFEEATLGNRQGVGPYLADSTGLETIYLAVMKWEQIKILGDETWANGNWAKGVIIEKELRLDAYRAATRSYRQLATALEGQGLKEEAERFAYRAQIMQRKMLWWRLRQVRVKIGEMCQKYHNLAKKGFYASIGELGDDMRQEN